LTPSPVIHAAQDRQALPKAPGIGIVIARHNRRHWGAQRLQPVPGHLDLAIERQIDQITGNGNVERSGSPSVGDDRVDDGIAYGDDGCAAS
jgi:hypothetical protein